MSNDAAVFASLGDFYSDGSESTTLYDMFGLKIERKNKVWCVTTPSKTHVIDFRAPLVEIRMTNMSKRVVFVFRGVGAFEVPSRDETAAATIRHLAISTMEEGV